MYPENDTDFTESTIRTVATEVDGGHSITGEDGWSFYVQAGSPITPKPGMVGRFYGEGIGHQVRGLFLDGVKVFYRTAAEDEHYRAAVLYGADAKDWLARWDAGKGVWSIEMGGLGPGYEQAIQIAAAEVLRVMLAQQFDAPAWKESAGRWDADRASIETVVFKLRAVEVLGLSGAQWGAALGLAREIYRNGPIALFADRSLKDRHIQVCRMNSMTETLTWHDAAHKLPDDDTTVLVQSPNGSEPVWPGFHDELGWHHVENAVATITVHYWAELPTGPIGRKA